LQEDRPRRLRSRSQSDNSERRRKGYANKPTWPPVCQKSTVLSFLELLLAHGRDERRHRFRGVGRIEKQRFRSRRQLDRFLRRGRRNPVAVADEPIVDLDRRAASDSPASLPRRA